MDTRLTPENQIAIEAPAPGGRRILVGVVEGDRTALADQASALAKGATALRRELHDLAGAPLGPLARSERAAVIANAAIAEAELTARAADDAEHIGIAQAAAALVSLRPAHELPYIEVHHLSVGLQQYMAKSENAKATLRALSLSDPQGNPFWTNVFLYSPGELTGLSREDQAAIIQRLGQQQDPAGHARIQHARAQAVLPARAAAALVAIAREANADLKRAPVLARLAGRAG